MAGEESGRKSAFKVQDRRRFSATGEPRDEVEPTPEQASAEPTAAAASPEPEQASSAAAPDEPPPAAAGAEITFASFVLSLVTQALVHLGEMPDPANGTTRVQLAGAQQI